MTGMNIKVDNTETDLKEFKGGLKLATGIFIDQEYISVSLKPKRGYKKCAFVSSTISVKSPQIIYVKRGKGRR